MIILDTNVVSELMRPSPSSEVEGWVRQRPPRELYTTAITLAEIRYGIERLPAGRRKNVLRTTADDIFLSFADQVLAFDAAAAVEYATVVTTRDHVGTPINTSDAQIASICRVNHASLATRNLDDFDNTGIELMNPWLHST